MRNPLSAISIHPKTPCAGTLECNHQMVSEKVNPNTLLVHQSMTALATLAYNPWDLRNVSKHHSLVNPDCKMRKSDGCFDAQGPNDKPRNSNIPVLGIFGNPKPTKPHAHIPGFPKMRGTFSGVPFITCWCLYWGPPNYLRKLKYTSPPIHAYMSL